MLQLNKKTFLYGVCMTSVLLFTGCGESKRDKYAAMWQEKVLYIGDSQTSYSKFAKQSIAAIERNLIKDSTNNINPIFSQYKKLMGATKPNEIKDYIKDSTPRILSHWDDAYIYSKKYYNPKYIEAKKLMLQSVWWSDTFTQIKKIHHADKFTLEEYYHDNMQFWLKRHKNLIVLLKEKYQAEGKAVVKKTLESLLYDVKLSSDNTDYENEFIALLEKEIANI